MTITDSIANGRAMNSTVVKAAVGALSFFTAWIVISFLFSTEILWVSAVAGAVAWFVIVLAISRLRQSR